MFPVDFVTAGPTAASSSLAPSGPAGPLSVGVPTGAVDFAQALIDAQAAGTSEAGALPSDAASAVPEWGAVREARGDARFAVWFAMGVAAHATASAGTPAADDATPSVSAREAEVGEPHEPAELSASPADHDLQADMPALLVLAVPGPSDWSMPTATPGLPQSANEEPAVPSELAFARIGNEPAPTDPRATYAETRQGSEAAPRVTDAVTVPEAAVPRASSAAAPQAASDDTEASLPHDLHLRRIEPPRARGEVHRLEPNSMSTTTPPIAPRDEPTNRHASIGASDTAPVEAATSERPTEAAALPTLAAKTPPTTRAETRVSMPISTRLLRAEIRAIGQSTVTPSTSTSRPVSEESRDSTGALAVKHLRPTHGPTVGAWLPALSSTSVAAVASPPSVTAPAAVVHLDTPEADDLRSQIVQAMRVQWSGASGDARIRLQPHYLGELSISLRVEQGVVSAQLTASSPEVRHWLEANEVVLRQGLAQHELKLERLVVSKDEPAPSPQHEHESEPRGHQSPKRRARRSDTDATFEVVV